MSTSWAPLSAPIHVDEMEQRVLRVAMDGLLRRPTPQAFDKAWAETVGLKLEITTRGEFLAFVFRVLVDMDAVED